MAGDPTMTSHSGFVVPPLGRVSKVEALVERIARLIYAGEIPPGAPVRDQQLVERFDAGRQSVRSALQQLARDGLLEHKPNRGWYVRELTSADVEDVFLLLQALACEVVRTVRLWSLPRTDVDAALEALRRLTPAGSRDELVLAALGVHRAILAQARSASMDQAFDAAATELRLALAQADVGCADAAQVHAELTALVEALWRRAPAAAEASVRAYVARLLARLVAALD
jgi:DNA-binding GntR family transcriptional regulator